MDIYSTWSHKVVNFIFLLFHNAQVNIPKRRTLIQVLPSVKFFCYLLVHICILPENCNETAMHTPWCTHWLSHCIYAWVTNKRIGEYARTGGKEFCVRIGWRKYLNECTPSGCVNLWMYQKSKCQLLEKRSTEGKSGVKVEKCPLVAKLRLKMLTMKNVIFSLKSDPMWCFFSTFGIQSLNR